jgi:hypothetical protein
LVITPLTPVAKPVSLKIEYEGAVMTNLTNLKVLYLIVCSIANHVGLYDKFEPLLEMDYTKASESDLDGAIRKLVAGINKSGTPVSRKTAGALWDQLREARDKRDQVIAAGWERYEESRFTGYNFSDADPGL